MNALLKASMAVLLLLAPLAYASSVTIGNPDSGNCYPFMCNDSGTNTGTNMIYQETYNSSAFTGPITIASLGFQYDPNFGGNDVILGGNYDLYLGYSSSGLVVPVPTSSSSNYASAPVNFDDFTVTTGGTNFGSNLVITGTTPFTYDPTNGDLLLTVVVTNQDNVPNGSGNGYMFADYTGTNVLRSYYDITGSNSGDTGALDTTFTPVPEPASWFLLATGLMALIGTARWKSAQNL